MRAGAYVFFACALVGSPVMAQDPSVSRDRSRAAATRAQAEVDAIVAHLVRGDVPVAELIERMTFLDAAAFEPLAAWLPSCPAAVRPQLLPVLMRISPVRSQAILPEWALGADSLLAADAAAVLCEHGDVSTLRPLVAAFTDDATRAAAESLAVAIAARVGLGEEGERLWSIARKGQTTGGERDPGFTAALHVLVAAGESDATREVVAGLQSPDLRMDLLGLLGRLSPPLPGEDMLSEPLDEALVRVLAEALEEPKLTPVRRAAFQALGRHGRLHIVPALLEALEGQTEPRILSEAVACLNGLTRTRYRSITDWRHYWDQDLAPVLARWDDLLADLQSPSGDKVVAALVGLGKLRHQRTLTAIERVLHPLLDQGTWSSDDERIGTAACSAIVAQGRAGAGSLIDVLACEATPRGLKEAAWHSLESLHRKSVDMASNGVPLSPRRWRKVFAGARTRLPPLAEESQEEARELEQAEAARAALKAQEEEQ